MLAFHEWLARVASTSSGDSNYAGLIGAEIFATVRLEPKEGTQTLSLSEWAKFMRGEPYRAEPYKKP